MFGLKKAMQNRIVQVVVRHNGQTKHLPAIQMVEGAEIVQKVDGDRYTLFLNEEGVVSIINSAGRIAAIECDDTCKFAAGDSNISFTHKEDFVNYDGNFFVKFCVYSVIAHIMFAIAFTYLPDTTPKTVVTKEKQVDKKRIADLLKKIQKKPEPKKVVKKPEPKKPEVKKVAKKVKKVKRTVKKPIKKPKKVVKATPKKIQKKRVVKKISKKPTVARTPTPKPKIQLARKIKPAGPTKAQLLAKQKAAAAAAKAKAQAAAKAKALKSLNFLSGGAGSFALKSDYDPKKSTGNYAAAASTSVKAAAGFGNLVVDNGNGIKTKGSRSVASGKSISDSGYEKALNGIQGRVSSSDVSGGKFSDSLLSKNMTLSGSGDIPQSEIEKILGKHIAKLRYCYEKALLTNSSLRGNLTMKWTIGTTGSVGGVKVVKSELNNGKLHNCVSQKLAGIRFPKPKGGGKVMVNYPFSFNSSSL